MDARVHFDDVGVCLIFLPQLRRCVVKPKKVEVFDGPRSGTMDNNGSHWGWRWLERWMAAKPWESSFPDISRQHASVLVNVMEHNMDAQLVKSIECTPTSSSKFVKKRSLSMPETMFDDYSNVGSAMASKRPKSMTHGFSNTNNIHANRPGYMQSTQSTKAKEAKARARNVQQRR